MYSHAKQDPDFFVQCQTFVHSISAQLAGVVEYVNCIFAEG